MAVDRFAIYIQNSIGFYHAMMVTDRLMVGKGGGDKRIVSGKSMEVKITSDDFFLVATKHEFGRI